ncbi:LuxR C-terminal-related transcriptional regulator [Actinoplanes sp. TRM 88003]|uniref:LuxR C-terminal-related transcriptional regulator n=1 Tax=Paractinoplanes aksuensis TaxID=2939490 RepID=A0ABT1DT19_9ACTN|nr:LuxR family transcriptional regulator [Actinoplanes aksuensis]MCO8273960.1 LuxR C-terminal-related transcriptional regulator [Actinoplanes aksuensis]
MTNSTDGPALLGRAAEERSIRDALSGSAGGPRTLALVGDAGIGKTALLRHGVALARTEGFRVVDVPPAPGPTLLTSLFEAAGRPVDEARLRAPGPVARRMAALGVVEQLCRPGPVLIALDDITPDDRETLAFVTRRLPGRRLVVLMTSRSAEVIGRPDDQIVVCPVPPLSVTAAAGLLDGVPHPPVGRVRAEILRLARGNPEVLSALARRAAGFGDDFRPPADLPAAAHRLLLVAAAGEQDDLGLLLDAAGADRRDCRAAEVAGLVTVAAGRLTFRHPLTRVGYYFTATSEDRRDAHSALVRALPADAPGRAWHVAQLVRPTDDGAPAAYERAAEASASRGQGWDAAAMFERAAECSPDDREAARFYGRAAAEADRSGDIGWTLDLWRRMLSRTSDPVVRATTAAALGNTAMFRPGRTVLGPLNRLLTEPLPDPDLVARLLSLAARTVLSDGHPADVATLRKLINRSTPPGLGVALAHAVADPAGWTGRYGSLPGSPLMRPASDHTERSRLMSVAGIAWVVDETEIAADYYRRALDRAREEQSYGGSALATVVFTEVLLEGGQLDEAAAVLRDATEFVGGNRSAVIRHALAAQQATVLIRRGELDEAAARLDRDRAAGPPAGRLVRYLRQRAIGQLAAASGDHDAACTAFRQMFEADGTPVHFLMSQRSVVELAAAALASGRRAEVDRMVRTARARAARPTGRREWSWRVAAALLHPDEDAARRRLSALLAHPDAADRWPHEYATAQAAYADRLRAERQSAPARPLLVSALDIFVRVGAEHEAAGVREKLRAAGVRAAGTGEPTFAELTPQQQMIARLAADGLSNRDIATRISIAPRTVSFHLYKIFPKLGISRRAQLRGVVMAA